MTALTAWRSSQRMPAALQRESRAPYIFRKTHFMPRANDPAAPTPLPAVATETTPREARLLEEVRSLQARQRHLVSLLDSARDAVLEMDAEGKVTSWNLSAETMLGWSAQEAVGASMCELIVPHKHRAAHEAGLALYLQTGKASTINRLLEIEALHKSGRLVPVELSIFTITVDQRKIGRAHV